ncbi:MAG: 2-amino-4-hydroxy-6-hydroxymethyldihydropteridine diphosphokinase [Dehalococcoidales bacterium]|nr:2-amino-4-hydroxy-6-hydroxymethyldihydropteridine diphosphokinase [Dehalococcoidales bacterium]
MAEAVTIYLGLGSNLGNREENLKKAVEYLGERMRLGKVSSVYDTDPLGDTDQPRFLNMVCELSTTLTPEGLLTTVKGIESKMGRTGKTGVPRPIDIDILLYGNMVYNTPQLTIPHPRMHERAFVLVPLAEIAPDVIHPVKNKAIKQMLKGLKEVQGVFRWDAGQEA